MIWSASAHSKKARCAIMTRVQGSAPDLRLSHPMRGKSLTCRDIVARLKGLRPAQVIDLMKLKSLSASRRPCRASKRHSHPVNRLGGNDLSAGTDRTMWIGYADESLDWIVSDCRRALRGVRGFANLYRLSFLVRAFAG